MQTKPTKTEVVPLRDTAAIVENVIIRGDLSQLTEPERIAYYQRVCESAGLNPLTKPFEYLTLNNKLVLYATRAATDQLRAVRGISVTEMTDTERSGVYAVTVKVQDKDGRTDMATGAVRIEGLKGDALANAYMKAETKAKRRATLSLSGLGLLDETEVETIPSAQPVKSSYRAKKDGDFDGIAVEVRSLTSVEAMTAWRQANADKIAAWPAQWRESFEDVIWTPHMVALEDGAPQGETPTAKVIAIINACTSKTALREYIRDPATKAIVKGLSEDEYGKVEIAYEDRLNELPET